jgi:broad specificity phosphatase PhoE
MDSTSAVPQPSLRPDTGGAAVLLLIRHGRSADVVPGSPESLDPPLHVEGVAQAAALAARLEAKRIDAIYASQLTRAVQTAQPLADQRGLAIESIEDLEEVRLGDWAAGEFRRRAMVADPEWLAWRRTRRWDGIPGAEGDLVFRTRVTAAVDEIAGRHPGQTTAIVVHGGVINAYLAQVLEIPHSLWLTVENTSITMVEVGDGEHHVVVAGDCHHLYDPVLAT